jgi:hypothetical protein
MFADQQMKEALSWIWPPVFANAATIRCDLKRSRGGSGFDSKSLVSIQLSFTQSVGLWVNAGFSLLFKLNFIRGGII